MKTLRIKRSLGFTLVELLVAMAITSIIVTVLVYVTSMSLDTWNRSRSEIRASRQAKTMLRVMARDLESFVSRNGNDFEWLSAIQKIPESGPGKNSSSNAIDLIFFSAATDRYDGKIGTDDDLGGDVSTVGYTLSYQNTITGAADDKYSTFAFYRELMNPNDTFTDVLGESSITAAFGDINTSSTNFICENIYQFTIAFYVEVQDVTENGTQTKQVVIPIKTGTGGAKTFQVLGNGLETDLSESSLPAGIDLAEIKAGRVIAAEVSVTVLSDFGVQQLRQRSGLSGTALSDFLAKNSYQYSKLIRMPSP